MLAFMMPDSLTQLHHSIWRELAEAVTADGHPFRFAAFSTISSGRSGADEPSSPDVRMVVLRAVDIGRRELSCYSDVRAAKVTQLRHFERAAWLFYDPTRLVQIRAFGGAVIETGGEIVDAAWEAVDGLSVMNYASASAPGELIASPGGVSGLARTAAHLAVDRESARRNFAVIRTTIDEMDWLQLGLTGHRRARLTYTASDTSGHWVQP
ncbi:MAG: hypothetical protein KF841_12605 [Phycisphaerae bacterium]|nr:hypothetical protein [Phycisphaerae bacterium]